MADIKALSRVLIDEDFSFVMCHTLGHAWERHKTDDYKGKYDDSFLLSLQCIRCTKIRRDFIDPRTGWLIDRSYVAPKNYSVGRDIKDLIALQQIHLRQAYRLELVARLTEGK